MRQRQSEMLLLELYVAIHVYLQKGGTSFVNNKQTTTKLLEFEWLPLHAEYTLGAIHSITQGWLCQLEQII